MNSVYNTDMKKTIKIMEHKLDGFVFSHLLTESEQDTVYFKRHVHSYYEIMCILDGEVEYMVENRQYVLKKGDVLLLKPAQYHFVRRIFKPVYRRYCIGFIPEIVFDKKFPETVFARGEKFTLGEDSTFFKLACSLGDKLEKSLSNDAVFCQGLLCALLVSLDDAKPVSEKSESQNENNFQKIVNYVNMHLTNIKSVEDISSALFFSKSYIMHLFRSELKVGVMQYVRNKKVLLAHAKISEGSKPTEIFLDCGFSNYPTFYRAYVSYFGHSPRKTAEL